MLIYFIHPGFIICRPNFILVLIHRLHCQIDSIHPLDSPRPTSLSYATSFLWFPLFLIQPLSCVAVKTCNCVILTLLDLRLALSFPAWIVPTNALGCPHIVVCAPSQSSNNTCLSLPLLFLLFHFLGPLLDLALFPLPIFPSYQFLPHSSSSSFLSLSSFAELHPSFSAVSM